MSERPYNRTARLRQDIIRIVRDCLDGDLPPVTARDAIDILIDIELAAAASDTPRARSEQSA